MPHYNKFSHYNKALTIDEIMHKIAQKTNSSPKLYGRGYKLRCPAHEDQNPSFCISVADNGTILMHCYAGCTFQEICQALAIHPQDLFPPKKGFCHD